MAQRHALERATDVLALGDANHGAEKNRRYQTRLHRLAVDLPPNQLREDERALRVSDEDETASLVVVLQVVIEGVAYVGILQPALERGAATAAGKEPAQPGKRDLAVERRIRFALRRK